MKSFFTTFLLSFVCVTHMSAVHADLIWNNGDLSTGSVSSTGATAPNGTTWSQVMSGRTLGFNSQLHNYRVADDFGISSEANIDSLTFFAYQTGSGTNSKFTGLYARIWNASPSAGGSVVWGDMSTNLLSSSLFADMYRISTTSSGTSRPIIELQASNLNINLSAGTYWLEIGTTGTRTSGPWAPPIVATQQSGASIANALQLDVSTGTWSQAVDAQFGVGYDFAFRLGGSYSAVPEASSAAQLAIALVGMFISGSFRNPSSCWNRRITRQIQSIAYDIRGLFRFVRRRAT